MPKFLPPVLESERLILCPLTVDDLDAVFKWTGDPRVNKYMIYPLYKFAEDGREWLESLYEDEKKLDYGFVLKSTGELIGSGGLYYHKDIDVWSIGYNLAYDHWHHGYTPEAISRILEYAQKKYGVHVLWMFEFKIFTRYFKMECIKCQNDEKFIFWLFKFNYFTRYFKMEYN